MATKNNKLQQLILKLAPYTKAVSAFIALCVPVATAVATATEDGIVTTPETIVIVAAVGALIGGTGAVYQFKNAPLDSGK